MGKFIVELWESFLNLFSLKDLKNCLSDLKEKVSEHKKILTTANKKILDVNQNSKFLARNQNRLLGHKKELDKLFEKKQDEINQEITRRNIQQSLMEEFFYDRITELQKELDKIKASCDGLEKTADQDIQNLQKNIEALLQNLVNLFGASSLLIKPERLVTIKDFLQDLQDTLSQNTPRQDQVYIFKLLDNLLKKRIDEIDQELFTKNNQTNKNSQAQTQISSINPIPIEQNFSQTGEVHIGFPQTQDIITIQIKTLPELKSILKAFQDTLEKHKKNFPSIPSIVPSNQDQRVKEIKIICDYIRQKCDDIIKSSISCIGNIQTKAKVIQDKAYNITESCDKYNTDPVKEQVYKKIKEQNTEMLKELVSLNLDFFALLDSLDVQIKSSQDKNSSKQLQNLKENLILWNRELYGYSQILPLEKTSFVNPGFSLFIFSTDDDDYYDDFKAPYDLIRKLKRSNDPISKYLYSKLSSNFQKKIADCIFQDESFEEMHKCLVTDFNDLLKQDIHKDILKSLQDIKTKVSSDIITLSKQQSLNQEEKQRLNRLLLEAAYPEEIVQTNPTISGVDLISGEIDKFQTTWSSFDKQFDFFVKINRAFLCISLLLIVCFFVWVCIKIWYSCMTLEKRLSRDTGLNEQEIYSFRREEVNKPPYELSKLDFDIIKKRQQRISENNKEYNKKDYEWYFTNVCQQTYADYANLEKTKTIIIGIKRYIFHLIPEGYYNGFKIGAFYLSETKFSKDDYNVIKENGIPGLDLPTKEEWEYACIKDLHPANKEHPWGMKGYEQGQAEWCQNQILKGGGQYTSLYPVSISQNAQNDKFYLKEDRKVNSTTSPTPEDIKKATSFRLKIEVWPSQSTFPSWIRIAITGGLVIFVCIFFYLGKLKKFGYFRRNEIENNK